MPIMVLRNAAKVTLKRWQDNYLLVPWPFFYDNKSNEIIYYKNGLRNTAKY